MELCVLCFCFVFVFFDRQIILFVKVGSIKLKTWSYLLPHFILKGRNNKFKEETFKMEDTEDSEDFYKIAQKELNETIDTRSLDIEALRDKIKLRPDILINRDDDEFLIRFLRARKYNKDKAFDLLCHYCQFRRKHQTFFKSLKVSCLRPVFEDGLPMVSPVRDQNGRSVIFLFSGNWNTSLYTFEDILRALLLTVEYLIESERTQLFGVTLVIDFTGWKLGDTKLINKQHLLDAVNVFQNCFPARFKGIHLINQPWYVRVMLTLIKPSLKRKAASRVSSNHSYSYDNKKLFKVQISKL